MLLSILLAIILIVASMILTFGTYQTIKVQSATEQHVFLAGKIPTKAPDGIYKGSVKNVKTNWIGKKFHAKDSTGINNFREGDKTVEKYPFRTYVAKGIQDTNKDVLKIDYNIASNPLWLRFILDEVVETQPNKLLGKVHIHLLPGIAFSMGYFMLEKSN